MVRGLALTSLLAALGGLTATARAAPPVARCDGIVWNETVQLSPEKFDAPYKRCGFLGGERAWDAVISADHRYLAARSNTGIVHLVQIDGWREVTRLASPVDDPAAVAFSPDGSLLAMLSGEVLSLWSTEDGKLTRAIRFPERRTYRTGSIAFSADGTRIATSLATVVDLNTGAVVDWNASKPLVDSIVNNLFHYQDLRFVDGERQLLLRFDYLIGSGPGSRGLFLLRPDTLAFTQLRTGWWWVASDDDYAVSPDGTRVLVGAEREHAELWDIATGKPVFELDRGSVPVAFSPDSARFHVLHEGQLRTHDARTGAPLGAYAWPGGIVRGIAPGGALVTATASQTRWVASDGTTTRSLDAALTRVRWSADGALAVASSDGALLRVYSEPDGAELCTLPADPSAPSLASVVTPHTDVAAIRPPPWSQIPVSRSADGSIEAILKFDGYGGGASHSSVHIIDRRTGATLQTFFSQADRKELGVVVSSDGTKIYTHEAGNRKLPYVAVWCRTP